MKIDAALLIVDFQKDFCAGGTLAVPGAEEIISRLNEYGMFFNRLGLPIFASRDWHPHRSKHFRDFGGLWPVHCVQETEGAAFHEDLRLPDNTIIISKGINPKGDDYSCFSAHDDNGIPFTALLEERGISTLYVGGVATDYCIKETVLDALRYGFNAVILQDGIRGVDVSEGDSARAIAAMTSAGAETATFELVIKELSEERK